LTDSRKGQGKRHRLATLYSIIACAKLSGTPGGCRAIYLYARRLTKPQRRALHCWINPRTGDYEVPSETSFFRALKIVPVEQVQAAVDSWLDQKLGPMAPGGQVAIDGKTLHHSGVHLVSAIQVPSQRCLGVEAVADKTNEITAVRQLMERTDLEGRLVEMDALNTQDETVQKLLYEKGADYIVSLKDNQPTLAATAQNLLPRDVPPSGSHDGGQSRPPGAAGHRHADRYPRTDGTGRSPTSSPSATDAQLPRFGLCGREPQPPRRLGRSARLPER
jgi:hypothetical protein